MRAVRSGPSGQRIRGSGPTGQAGGSSSSRAGGRPGRWWSSPDATWDLGSVPEVDVEASGREARRGGGDGR